MLRKGLLHAERLLPDSRLLMPFLSTERFTFKAVTCAEWPDFERVFLSVPGSSMCWCMYWRKTRGQWWDNAAENRADMGEVIEAYPMTNLPRKRQTVGEAFMGFSTTFERLGFEQVSERSRVRNIWRLRP